MFFLKSSKSIVDETDPYHILETASPENKNNYDYVLPLVKKKGGVLSRASNDLQNNFEIVLTAVQNTCLAILFASDEKKANPVIFRAAYLNGFDKFICPKYINYLYNVGDYINANWVRDLYMNKAQVDSLLTEKNSCDFDISHHMPEIEAKRQHGC